MFKVKTITNQIDGERINREERWAELEGTETIVFVMDVWDKHWCKDANGKLATLASEINSSLKGWRAKGVKIMHMPNDCIHFYDEYEQRKRVLQEPPFKTSRLIYYGNGVNILKHGFFLHKTEGCPCRPRCNNHRAWEKQHPNIEIAPADLIATDPKEIFSYLKNQQVKNIIYMGAHANICLLKRPMGILKLTQLGFNCFLDKDRTDILYNTPLVDPGKRKEIKEKIYDFIERKFCPRIEFVKEDS